VNTVTAALACLTCVAYLAIYTPLKKVTPLNTLVGAIPGAIPPVMGWTAARGQLTVEAAVLFAILFLWQMPHFLAIAWLYRDDYRAAGLRMLPGAPGGDRRTGRAAVLHAAALLPVVVLPSVFGLAGRIYLTGAILLALGFLAAAVHLAARCDDRIARRLFRASLVFLPLLLLLMALDRVTP
jgi:heme o synthase